ncbi:MAG TPA: hypothetical protein VGH98_07220 [Gemmatimonadaceae bacterium]|jgi:hypothetical protein
MNSEPLPSESARSPIVGATLQAVLLFSDGSMDSIAVPVPLPEAIVRVQPAAPAIELHFRRARSADSVVRYGEELTPLADGGAATFDASERRCTRCQAVRGLYYVPKLAPNEPIVAATAAYCDVCYPKAAV